MRDRKPRADLQSFLTGPTAEPKRKKPRPQNTDDLDKLDALYSWYTWSNCKLAQRYDEERNFFPQPGPSNLNYYEDDDIVGYYRPVGESKKKVTPHSNAASSKKLNAETKTPPKTRGGRKRNGTQALSPIPSELLNSDNSDWEDDIQVQSIYEQSFAEHLNMTQSPHNDANSPLPNHSQCNGYASKTPKTAASFMDTTISSPLLTKFMENVKLASKNEMNDQLMANHEIRIIGQCKITPLELAPTHNDVLNEFGTHNLPKMTHPTPFYSNPNDILAENAKKEIGHTVLQLYGNGIDDCEEFRSELSVDGLVKWQRAIPNGLRITRGNCTKTSEMAGKFRKIFARERTTEIVASELPPSHSEAVEWLNERKTKKRASNDIDVVHPAKVQRQNSNHIKMNGVNHHANANGDEKRDVLGELLAKKGLTVTRITRSNKSKNSAIPETTDTNRHPDADDDRADDHSEDDVLCLSDNLPKKQSISNSFCQVGRPRRIHLK